MSGIKTGNKGFVNPVDGKVYTVDSVAPGADGANDDPSLPDPGNMTVDNTIKDIGKITRVTLGTYLSKMTNGAVGSAKKPNAYTIDASNDATPQSSITTPTGYPVPLAPSNNTSQFKQVLPSAISDDYSVVAASIKKGSAPGTGTDGNKLLRGATANDSSTTLVLNGPVDKYTAEVLDANRWDPSSEFTGGVDPSAVPNNFNVSLQSVATAVLPSSEATDPSNAQYQLNLGKAASAGPKKTEKNDFPVTPNPNNALQLVAITTNEAPSPLTPQQGAPVFAPNIGNSYTNDYTELNVNAAGGLQKGSTSAEGPNGNEFLSKATVSAGQITSPTPLVDYTAAAVIPNVRDVGGPGFSQGEDISNPSSKFNPSLQSVATMVSPAEEAIASTNAQYELDLKLASKKPAEITTNNAYPVSEPNLGQNLENLAKLTTADLPSPLTPASSANLNVHAPNLQPSESDVFIAHGAGINKGKSKDRGYDGNSLLGSAIEQNAQGTVGLPDSLETYTSHVTEQNDRSPFNPLLPSEIDPTAPPAGYHPYLADVSTLGSHTGAPHDQLTLNELRRIGATKTQDAKNDYPVDKNLAALTAVTEIDGYPAQLADTGNSEKYAERSEIAPTPNETIKFNKGKGAGEWNGNNIWRDVQGTLRVVPELSGEGVLPGGTPVNDGKITKDPKNPINEYRIDDHKRSSGKVSPFALGNSRFISKAQFVDDSQPIPEFNPIVYRHGDNKRGVSTLKMAKIGVGLSQRASTEIPGWPSGQFDPTGDAAEAGAILPSVSQLGILKVNNNLLSAKDVLNSIIDAPDYDPDALVEIAPFGGQSWGNLNNVSEPFSDGSNSVGLFLTMIALIIAIVLLFSFIAWVVPSGTRSTTIGPSGERTLGKYLFTPPAESSWLALLPDPAEIFGIKQTINPYEDALLAGTYSFFLGAENADYSILDLTIALLTGGLDQITKDNNTIGANLVVCRTIIRSGLVMAEQITSVIKKSQLSPVAGVKSAINLLRAFRSSKLISAINVFSSLGDQLLNSRRKTAQAFGPDGKEVSIPLDYSTIDANLLPQSTVRKHRMTYTQLTSDPGDTEKKKAVTVYNPTLTWSSQRAPSMYLIPNSVRDLQLADISNNNLGSFKGPSALDYQNSVVKSSITNNRISDAERIEFEKRLDSEYVPFYFHDIRTNEIISFHAFLNSLGDSFNIGYDSVEAFGRVEPIKIYKSTSRKIDMSFYLVSTSPEDFDHMWYKINKLTTMIYPQYTKGRLLSTDGTQIRSPFSQLVGASPLVRIRLGDLFKSNYSRFALARLFGAADGNMKVTNDNKPVDIKDLLGSGGADGKIKEYSARRTEYKTGDRGFLSSNMGQLVEIIKDSSPYTYKQINIGANGVKRPVGEELRLRETIVLDRETEEKIIKDIFGETSAAYSALVSFMSPEKNTIVKSFETAGGKGLAGYIDNMSFDWYDKVTWEVDPGRTAPKMCKITVSFSPIHDISPGIDHLGYNRAPIYGVGAAMNSDAPSPGSPGG